MTNQYETIFYFSSDSKDYDTNLFTWLFVSTYLLFMLVVDSEKLPL